MAFVSGAAPAAAGLWRAASAVVDVWGRAAAAAGAGVWEVFGASVLSEVK